MNLENNTIFTVRVHERINIIISVKKSGSPARVLNVLRRSASVRVSRGETTRRLKPVIHCETTSRDSTRNIQTFNFIAIASKVEHTEMFEAQT